MAPSRVSALRCKLAFARFKRHASSERGKNPDLPRLLVAAMQDRAHRECAGEMTTGTISCSTDKAASHACASPPAIRRWSNRTTPQQSAYSM
eukprot:3400177-Prymnesium_polylepis.2